MVTRPLVNATSLSPTFELTQHELPIESPSRSNADLPFVSQALDAPDDEDEESDLPLPYYGA